LKCKLRENEEKRKEKGVKRGLFEKTQTGHHLLRPKAGRVENNRTAVKGSLRPSALDCGRACALGGVRLCGRGKNACRRFNKCASLMRAGRASVDRRTEKNRLSAA